MKSTKYRVKKILLERIIKIMKLDYCNEYTKIKKIQNKKEFTEFQKEYLTKLLIHCYKNVPYYSHIFQDIGLIEDNTVNFSKFENIPILTKDLIRENEQQLFSKDYTKRKWYYNSSGGSTGEPVKLIQDESVTKWGKASLRHYYESILGIDEENIKKVIVWGSERDIYKDSSFWMKLKFSIYNWLSNTVFLNSFKMSELDMQKYIERINKNKPDLIRGYASSLYELCNYSEKSNNKMHSPKIVVSSAETLRNEMRKKIECSFNTKVYNFYGSRETFGIAGECKEGLMHIMGFDNYIEVINEDGMPAREGEKGKVIVTNLHNYSMPLIRFEIGDVALLGPKKCKCGSFLPTLENITGRITDNFIKMDGTLIYGEYFTHLFYLKNWVKSFQVIQEHYDKIKIILVKKGTVNTNEKKDIEYKIKLVMGKNCIIDWEFTDEIPITANGKHLYTLSLINQNQH